MEKLREIERVVVQSIVQRKRLAYWIICLWRFRGSQKTAKTPALVYSITAMYVYTVIYGFAVLTCTAHRTLRGHV